MESQPSTSKQEVPETEPEASTSQMETTTTDVEASTSKIEDVEASTSKIEPPTIELEVEGAVEESTLKVEASPTDVEASTSDMEASDSEADVEASSDEHRPIKIGIIGGSGLDDPDILEDREELPLDTTFGPPSDCLIEGKIKNVDCVLLARHGRNHTLTPSDVNYRANITALCGRGCTHVIVTNACGSLKEEIKPGDLIFPDQFIDRTTKRKSTFYGSEMFPDKVAHIPMHTPFCARTREVLIESAKKLGYTFHESGTIVVIEGPRFSTRAESNVYRSWNADIIGMTTVPEVVLANELGLCYASIAMATDYDCWHQEEDAVCVTNVMEVMKQNVHKAKNLLLDVIPAIAAQDWTDYLEEKKNIALSAVM